MGSMGQFHGNLPRLTKKNTKAGLTFAKNILIITKTIGQIFLALLHLAKIIFQSFRAAAKGGTTLALGLWGKSPIGLIK